MNRNGQTMVEAVGVIWVMTLLFLCVYGLFVLAIGKVKSIDRTSGRARIDQVGRAAPHPAFLNRSWPGARMDRPSSARLMQEVLMMEAKAHFKQGEVVDLADDAEATRRAGES